MNLLQLNSAMIGTILKREVHLTQYSNFYFNKYTIVNLFVRETAFITDNYHKHYVRWHV